MQVEHIFKKIIVMGEYMEFNIQIECSTIRENLHRDYAHIYGEANSFIEIFTKPGSTNFREITEIIIGHTGHTEKVSYYYQFELEESYYKFDLKKMERMRRKRGK